MVAAPDPLPKISSPTDIWSTLSIEMSPFSWAAFLAMSATSSSLGDSSRASYLLISFIMGVLLLAKLRGVCSSEFSKNGIIVFLVSLLLARELPSC